jgi:hypothetical protein
MRETIAHTAEIHGKHSPERVLGGKRGVTKYNGEMLVLTDTDHQAIAATQHHNGYR